LKTGSALSFTETEPKLYKGSKARRSSGAFAHRYPIGLHERRARDSLAAPTPAPPDQFAAWSLFPSRGLRAKIAAVHVPGKPAHEARKETVALFRDALGHARGLATKRSSLMAAVLLAPAVSLISKTI